MKKKLLEYLELTEAIFSLLCLLVSQGPGLLQLVHVIFYKNAN